MGASAVSAIDEHGAKPVVSTGLTSTAPTPLREALNRSGISLRALARELSCDRRQVRDWVAGEHTPVSERRDQIARVVGAPVEELWPGAQGKQAA